MITEYEPDVIYHLHHGRSIVLSVLFQPNLCGYAHCVVSAGACQGFQVGGFVTVGFSEEFQANSLEKDYSSRLPIWFPSADMDARWNLRTIPSKTGGF